MEQLGSMMSAHEFSQHYLLEQVKPLHPVVLWRDPDASTDADTATADIQPTIDNIKASARAAGMAA